MWIFLILCEINFGESRSIEIAIFGGSWFVDLVNFSLQKFQKCLTIISHHLWSFCKKKITFISRKTHEISRKSFIIYEAKMSYSRKRAFAKRKKTNDLGWPLPFLFRHTMALIPADSRAKAHLEARLQYKARKAWPFVAAFFKAANWHAFAQRQCPKFF